MRGDGLTEQQAQERAAEKYAALKVAVDEFFEARRLVEDIQDEDHDCGNAGCAAHDFRDAVHSLSNFVVLAEYTMMAPERPELTGTATPTVSYGSPVAALGLVAAAFTDWSSGNL